MGNESKSRSESFNEWWYDYRVKNGLGDHTAKAEVALAAFNAGQQVSNSAQAAGTQSAPADTAPVSERRDSDTQNSINAEKYAGNGMGAWDNDALSDMARAVCRVFPKVGSMETAHKVVAAVVRAQEQFERNLR